MVQKKLVNKKKIDRILEDSGSGNKVFSVLIIGVILFELLLIILSERWLYFVVSSQIYMYFHLIVEVFTIIIGLVIFYYSSKAYDLTKSKVSLLIGWAFLAMAVIDIFHIFAYKGFPSILFTPGSNVAIWFWLPSRLIGGLLLLLSAFSSVYPKKLSEKFLKGLKYFLIVFIIVLIPMVIYNTFNNILPLMFVEGVGLTPLKIFLEYLVMGLFGISSIIYGVLLRKNLNRTLFFFVLGLVTSVFSELSFTIYTNVFDIFNMFGHFLKFLAYIFFFVGLYLAVKKEEE